MADRRCHLFDAERVEEADRIAHEVEGSELREVGVVAVVRARGAAIAALIRRNDMVAGVGKRRHDLAPAIGEFGKSVQQQQARPAPLAAFEDVHPQAIDAVDEARANTGRQGCMFEGGESGHFARLLLSL